MAAVPPPHLVLQPHDINCGPNFNGQNVACSPPNRMLKTYLAAFINFFVNALLSESGYRKSSCTPDNIQRLKKTMFVICSTIRFYTMFATYLQQMPSIDVDGVMTPLFNLDYIPNPLPPFQLSILSDDGTLLDCKILHLFVGGLAYHMLATVGWLREPHPGFRGVTLRGIYTTFLPRDALVPLNVRDACLETIKTSIQKEYVTLSVLFFGIGGGGSARDELSRSPGYITTYVANTDTINPPIPASNIVWNNANQLSSSMIFLSCIDQSGTDIEFLLQAVMGGTIIIRDMLNPVNFQEWQIIAVDVLTDQHVQYAVVLNQGQWQAPNGQMCQLVIMRPGQTVPTINDELSHQITNFTRQIGGVKKQNKSKRRKQKRSNKKSRHHHSR
jgi:hypothetical protein